MQIAKQRIWASKSYGKEWVTLEYDQGKIRADWHNQNLIYRLDGSFGAKSSDGAIELPMLRGYDESHQRNYILVIEKNGNLRGQIRIIDAGKTSFPDINTISNLMEYVKVAQEGLANIREMISDREEGKLFSYQQKLDMLDKVSRAGSAIGVLELMMLQGATNGQHEDRLETSITLPLFKVFRLD